MPDDTLPTEETKGWLPDGVTQGSLPDSSFAWLSAAYVAGDAPKTGNRKLPYRYPADTVNEDGWKAAWSRAHSMADADFDGGPSRSAVIKTLLSHKPAGVTVSDDEGAGASAADPRTREVKTFSYKAGDTTGLQEDEFQGYLAVFSVIDDGGDIILPGAFANTLDAFLRDGVMCWQHDWATPIGKWLEAREDGYGLFVKGRVSLTTAGKDALILLRDGVVKKLSIGYIPLGYRVLSEKEGIDLVGQTAYDTAMRALPFYRDGIRALTDITLLEGSPVSIPMMPLAAITGVKDKDMDMDSAGPLAGLPFADHFARVLAAHEELLTRVKSLALLRKKEGRVLSAVNQDKLQMMHDSLSEHVTTLDDLLAACAPPDGDATDPDGDGDADMPMGGKSLPAVAAAPHAGEPVGDGGPVPDDLTADVRRELARFLRTEARLLGVAV